MAVYSNRTIVALLAVALVITVIGTVVSVSKLNELGGTYNQLTYLTGAAVDSSTGQTNITISSTTAMALYNGTMNFGSGRVNSSCNICGMDSNNTIMNYYVNGSITPSAVGTGCCIGFNAVIAGFLIENTGNVNVSVGYTCAGNCTFTNFLGGGFGPAGSTLNPLSFEVNSQFVRKQLGEVSDTDMFQSCVGGGTSFQGYQSNNWNITNRTAGADSSGGFPEGANVRLSTTGHWLCGNYTSSFLLPDGPRDAAVLDINISIADNAPTTGVRSSFTLTFNATSQ